MKLSKIYSNIPSIFLPIHFKDGLNVILGNITRPTERTEDVHNLGKTILGQLIDFCLLRKKVSDFFLFKHQERFHEFVFYLEIKLHHNSYITLRRAVDPGTKISFVYHDTRGQDFTDLTSELWDHWNLSFDKSKHLLDGILNLSSIAPWSFRNIIPYCLRTQVDYDNPFKLAKFAGRHKDWKPLLAHILGLNGNLVHKNYELQEDVEKMQQEVSRLEVETQGISNLDKLRGIIDIREDEIKNFEIQLEEYNFDIPDTEINKELVNELDAEISDLNERRYYLNSAFRRTESSLEEPIEFDMSRIEHIFYEANIYFGEQIKKDFEELIRFNKSITEERNYYLKEELENLRNEIYTIDQKLTDLNRRKSHALSILKNRETFSKYRQLCQKLVDKKAELESLRRQEKSLEALEETKRKLQEKKRELEQTQETIEREIQSHTDRYKEIRTLFNNIVKKVINENAILYVKRNQQGNPEFEIVLIDTQGNYTGASEGYTYSRLLCIAFDMALQRSYVNDQFPHFIYHDGAMESVDDRKKLNLIDVIREYAKSGYQHIITAIDSELPRHPDGSTLSFAEDEIILKLHDQDNSGRLFMMDPW